MSEDFTSMNNPRFLYRAGLKHPFPDWVANEPMPAKEDFLNKSAAAFADPARRLLPICTPQAAFHSALNLMACPADFDEAAFERVKAACEQFQIEGDIAPYAQMFALDIEKSASVEAPSVRFAIDTVVDGQEYRLLPMSDGDDLVESAFELAKMAAENRIPISMLVGAAREIVKTAEDLGVSAQLPRTVTWFGSERYPDADRAAKLLEGRSLLCKDASARETLEAEYAAAIDDLVSDPDSAMEKIAALDYVAGISVPCRVAGPVPTPFDVVFGGPLVSEIEKAATENVLIRDVLVPLSAIQSIPDIEAEFKLSKSAASDLSIMRDGGDGRDISLVVAVWDDEDQKTLLRLAAQAA